MSNETLDLWSGGACSFVIPAYNEAELLADTVNGILAAIGGVPDTEIVIVENGSRDATYAIACQLAATHPQVRSHHEPVAGYGNAVRRGLLDARYDTAVVFDCDLWDLHFAATAATTAADARVAVVIASKRCAGAQDRRPLLRRTGTAVFTALVRAICGLQASDTHGMKLVRLDRVRHHVAASAGDPHTFDTEMILRCERDGWLIGEIPCTVEEARPARSGFLRRVPSTLASVYRIRRRLATS